MFTLYPCGVNKHSFSGGTEAVSLECSIQLTGTHLLLLLR